VFVRPAITTALNGMQIAIETKSRPRLLREHSVSQKSSFPRSSPDDFSIPEMSDSYGMVQCNGGVAGLYTDIVFDRGRKAGPHQAWQTVGVKHPVNKARGRRWKSLRKQDLVDRKELNPM